MPPAMVKKKKKDTSEEMSYLVDYGEKLSNFLDDLEKVMSVFDYLCKG